MAEQEDKLDTSPAARGQDVAGPTNSDGSKGKEATAETVTAAPKEGVTAPKSKAKGPGKTKGTTGATTTKLDGTKPTTEEVLAAQAAGKPLALTTVTGSDEDANKVYHGEPPMEPGDQYAASKGRDDLSKISAPEGDPYAGMGVQFMAQNSAFPVGPTGSIPTGAEHAKVSEVDKAVKVVKEASEKAPAKEDK